MKSHFLASFTAVLVALSTAMLQAQTTGGGTTGGGTTGGSTGGGTTSTGTTGGTTSSGTGGQQAAFSPSTQFTQLQNTGVGATADTVRSFNNVGTTTGGAAGGGARGGASGLGGLLGGLGFGGFGQNFGGSTATKPALRTRLRSRVEVAPLQPSEVQFSAQTRLYQTSSSTQLNGVQVNMNGGTAVISGVVGSEKDRRMSELLMRLEPGVRQVSNQVIVAP